MAAAVVVGVGDALTPTAARGTPADLAKMFGAAVTIPTLVNVARKTVAATAAKS